MGQNYIEFDFTTEDGIDVVVQGSGKVSYESNYAADLDDHKNYPCKFVTNIKFKCVTSEGSVLGKAEISEDDIASIEDIISNTLTYNEPQYESDFYDRFDD